MARNGHFSLESAWGEIANVKSPYNQQKLIEIYRKAAPFITKYQGADIKTLTTKEFAIDYLPLLKLIVKQSAGKKLLVSYTANPWIGVTKSVNWFMWLPTKVGSQAAMMILKSYVEELEQQAAGKHQDASTQTDDLSSESLPDLVPVPTDVIQDDETKNDVINDEMTNNGQILVPEPEIPSVSIPEPDAVTVPVDDPVPVDAVIDSVLVSQPNESDSAVIDQSNLVSTDNNVTNTTSGVGCGPENEWTSSDGEIEEVMAQFVHRPKIADETPHKPQLNSTLPTVTPSQDTTRRPSGPRKLTKGSRRPSLKDSGVNLTTCGAWEDSRKVAEPAIPEPAPAIIHESIDETKEIDLTDVEIIDFENGNFEDEIGDHEDGDNDVFNDSGDSFVEIPDLE